MQFDSHTISSLQSAVKSPTHGNAVKILYFDPQYHCVESVLKVNPDLRGFTSEQYLEEETVFVISKVENPYVNKKGIMHINWEDLSLILSAMFDFFVCTDKGVPLHQSLEDLIKILSGDCHGRKNYIH